MDIAPSILIESSSCLLASDAHAHCEKIMPLFQAELARFCYFGRFTVQVGFNASTIRSGGLEEQIFVTLDSPFWGLYGIVSARFSPIFSPFSATIQTPGTCYVLYGKFEERERLEYSNQRDGPWVQHISGSVSGDDGAVRAVGRVRDGGTSDPISANVPFHSVVQTTWGDDGHSSRLELSMKGSLGIRVSDNFVQHLTGLDKPVFLQVCKDTSVAPLRPEDWFNESPWVHITLDDLSVHSKPTDTQNYVIVNAYVAVAPSTGTTREIETSPGDDIFTPQDTRPPLDRTFYGGLITRLNRLLPSLVPGCAPEVTTPRRIWEMKTEMVFRVEDKGTGWTFLHNDYVYPHENPSSADFGIRHSALRGVANNISSGSDPVPTSGVIAVNCFIFWAPRPGWRRGKLQSIAHKLRAPFTSSRNSGSTKEPRPDLPVFANFMHRVTLLIDANRCLGKAISDKVQPKRQINMHELVRDSSQIDTLLPVELIPILRSGADSSATITLASEVPFPKAWEGRMKRGRLQKSYVN